MDDTQTHHLPTHSHSRAHRKPKDVQITDLSQQVTGQYPVALSTIQSPFPPLPKGLLHYNLPNPLSSGIKISSFILMEDKKMWLFYFSWLSNEGPGKTSNSHSVEKLFYRYIDNTNLLCLLWHYEFVLLFHTYIYTHPQCQWDLYHWSFQQQIELWKEK